MNKQKITYIFKNIIVLIIVVLMVAISEVLNEKEIIFPEITALAIGALIAPIQPWKVSKPKILILISLHSLIGLFLSSYINIDIYLKVIIGLILSLISLVISRCSLAPIISATILPILINSSSFIYPVSALLFTLVIVLLQLFFEKMGFQETNRYFIEKYNLKTELLISIQRTIVISILAFIALKLDAKFAIAPPLIVGFVEATSVRSKLTKNTFKVIILISIVSTTGCAIRILFTEYLGLALWFSALISAFIMLIAIKKAGLYFPPAGAIAILPMIINSEFLIWYPIEVILGFIVMMIFANLIRKERIYINDIS